MTIAGDNRFDVTRHNLADSVPTSNLVCIREVYFRKRKHLGVRLIKLLFSYTTQNLLRITFSFNDLMLKTNRLKKDFFCEDRLIFGLDDPVSNMSIRHVDDA